IAHFARRGDDEALPALAIGGVAALLVGGGAFAAAAGSDSALLFAGAGALVGLLAGYAVGLAATRPEGGYGAHWLALLGAGVQIGLLVALSVLMFLPFIRNYHLGYDTILPWEGSRTALWAYLDMFGLFPFVIASWLAVELWGWLRGRLNRRHTVGLVLGAVLLVAVTVLAAARLSPIAAAAVPLLGAALGLFMRRGQPARERLVLAVLVAALLLSLLVEVVVLAGDL